MAKNGWQLSKVAITGSYVPGRFWPKTGDSGWLPIRYGQQHSLRRWGPSFPDRVFLEVWGKRPRREVTGQASPRLPLPARARFFKQNQGEFWSSNLAVVQVVYAPTRFGEGGARCFVKRFSFSHRIVPKAGAFFMEDLGHHFPRGVQAVCYVINITVDHYFPEARLGGEKTARGYRSWGDKYMSRNSMGRRARWQGTPRSGLVANTM